MIILILPQHPLVCQVTAADGKVYEEEQIRNWLAKNTTSPMTGAELQVLDGHQRVVGAVAWDASGTRIASGSLDSTVRVWDASTSENLQTLEGTEVLEGLEIAFSTVSWSPSGTRIAAGSADGLVRIWESRLEDALPVWRAAAKRRSK